MNVCLSYYSGDVDLTMALLGHCIKLDWKTPHTCILFPEAHVTLEKQRIVELLARIYFKNVVTVPYEYGGLRDRPLPQNFVFRRIASVMERSYKGVAWLFLDPDSVPLSSGWLDAIHSEYCCECLGENKHFMGHVVPGMGHLNGIAVYPWNISHYAPKAMAAIDNDAIDVLLAKEIMEHVHDSPLFQQIWSFDEQGNPTNECGVPPTFKTREDYQRLIKPEAVLFHRCRDGSLYQWVNG